MIKSIKIYNESPHPYPEFKHPGDSGFDLRAWIDGDEKRVVLFPLERVLIHTGIYVQIPKDTELQIRPRSGCALKYGLVVLNTPGTVDSNYRGEVCVIAANISNEMLQINDGDRIAQAVLCPVYNSYNVSLDIVKDKNELSETERGSDGFNSTGLK